MAADLSRVILRGLRIAVPAILILLIFWIVYSKYYRHPFQAAVDTKLVPKQATVAARGVPQKVSASRDSQGIQTDFLEGIALLKPKNAAELKSFLDRYHGTVIGDDTIPEPPAELGLHLSAEERKPTQFKIRIRLGNENLSRVAANAAAVGLKGAMGFSSEAGLQTFSTIIDAARSGFRASGDYVLRADQSFPVTLFSTQEISDFKSPPTFTDAFTSGAYADYGATGNASNVRLAWQFIAAHGIKRRTLVAILDNGFYLDGGGLARGSNSDFPSPGRPLQYDIDFGDPFAGDAGDGSCGGKPCYWHGTGAAGVATGVANNQRGGAGTGGFVADPMLLRINSTIDERNQGIRTAVAWGADVVSMSFGVDCDVWCRMDDRDDNPFDQAVAGPHKVVFVASAGNGQGKPAAGYDVGAPSFVHPCIEDHVICVGALTPGTNTITTYSNFGAQVQVFAPTGISVMSYPPSADGAGNPLPLAQADGAPVPQVFGGTSASAPFVAGIIAMMKSVNPDLNHDDVALILRNTSRPGVGPVTRTVDAYAAVRQAAGTSPIVDDALERNDLEKSPSNLGSKASYNTKNLNIDNRDRDYFVFDSPGGSQMTLAFAYPDVLGSLAVQTIESPVGICQAPTPMGSPVVASGSKIFTYRVPGGPLLLGLSGSDVNAYNMSINFASDTYPPDVYEPNNTAATARYITSFRSAGIGSTVYVTDNSRVTIDATLHSSADVDFYLIRATALTLAERIFVASFASVQVYGNDSLINLDVFHLNADKSQGALVAHVNGVRCAPKPLEVRLDEGGYYLVRVSGDPGRYTLRNSIGGSPPQIPQKEHDHVYVVLHPGDPVEHVIRFPEVSVFAHDREFTGVRLAGQDAHLALFDTTGKQIAEGRGGQEGEALSLAAAIPASVYFLEITPKNSNASRPTTLTWEAATPQRISQNLIVNPGAEIGVQSENGDLPGWTRIDGLSAPRAIAYSDNGQSASPSGPGSKERGLRLFASGALSRPRGPTSGLQQSISLDDEWKRAIQEGRVTARLSAFLGGSAQTQSTATVTATFSDAGGQQTAQLLLPTVGPLERGGKTGLFPVDVGQRVPQGTQMIRVNLSFTGKDRNVDAQAFADNLQLILSKN